MVTTPEQMKSIIKKANAHLIKTKIKSMKYKGNKKSFKSKVTSKRSHQSYNNNHIPQLIEIKVKNYG